MKQNPVDIFLINEKGFTKLLSLDVSLSRFSFLFPDHRNDFIKNIRKILHNRTENHTEKIIKNGYCWVCGLIGIKETKNIKLLFTCGLC